VAVVRGGRPPRLEEALEAQDARQRPGRVADRGLDPSPQLALAEAGVVGELGERGARPLGQQRGHAGGHRIEVGSMAAASDQPVEEDPQPGPPVAGVAHLLGQRVPGPAPHGLERLRRGRAPRPRWCPAAGGAAPVRKRMPIDVEPGALCTDRGPRVGPGDHHLRSSPTTMSMPPVGQHRLVVGLVAGPDLLHPQAVDVGRQLRGGRQLLVQRRRPARHPSSMPRRLGSAEGLG
jgi:hypothetical protein